MTPGEAAEEQKNHPFTLFVADSLTVLRFLIGVFIVVLGMTVGPQALPAAVFAMLVGWITDCVDGPIARASGRKRDWVDRFDFAADLALGWSFFLFVVVTGLFPLVPAIVFAATAGVVVLIRPTEAAAQIVSAPVFGLPVVLSFHAGLTIGICWFVFLAAWVAYRWDRLVDEVKKCHGEACTISDES